MTGSSLARKRKLSNIINLITGPSSDHKSSPSDSWLGSKLPESYKYLKKQRTKKLEESETLVQYAPWSREKLLQRLSTYTIKNWDIPSSSQVSALECSKYGWEALNLDQDTNVRNRIQCVCCHMMLHLNVGSDVEVAKAMAQRYHEMLVGHHRESCPWKHSWCKSSLYSVPLVRSQVKESIYNRYSSLVRVQDRLSQVNLVFDPPVDRKSIEGSSILEAGICDYKAFILAIMGWRLESDSIGPKGFVLMSCEMCFRRLVCGDQQEIDIVDEHFDYCPYRRTDGTDEKEQAGWFRVYEALRLTKDSDSIRSDHPNEHDDNEEERSKRDRQLRMMKLKSIYRPRSAREKDMKNT